MFRPEKVTPQVLKELKEKGAKAVLLTAYDYPTALIEDSVGIDVILVGDSLAMTVLGHESTLSVGMDELLIACKAVRRGVKRAMVIADMPYMSYQPSNSLAIKNAGRFVADANVDGVKLEGAGLIVKRVKSIVDIGIPVMGHIGFTPQSIKKFGGYKVWGKTDEDVHKLIDDAKALETAGVFCIIVECVPESVVAKLKKAVSVPIYGIGAGQGCDGQILVVHDMLGLFPAFLPKYVKRYANLTSIIEKAIKKYIDEVKSGKFPDNEHSYH
ncbi:MAG: 3-methyl-2-oxobutanoate hydroxymethyltransferase [bacterium]|nr:3-methyl-2-oxobutanoate hydroxymethyltransferase [bacterium]